MPTSHEPSVNQQQAHRKGTTTMFKATVTRLFIGSLIALAAGATVLILAIALAIANNVFVMDGNDIAAIQGGALATALLGVAFLGALVLTGIFNFGFIAMLIYVIAGPDGKAARTAQRAGLPVGA